MPIDKATAGKYLGYTLGSTKPTLYFENGHLTQIHDDADNVGWHPNHGATHVVTSISDEGGDEFDSTDDLVAFTNDVINGDYEGDAFLFEYSLNEHNVVIEETIHCSRSSLNAPDDTYDQAYADDALANASLAPNEIT